MDKTLNSISKIYYFSYFFFSFIVHFCFFYLILSKTTQLFKTMKFFLVASNFCNFFLAFLTFLVQPRLVSNEISKALLAQGFCKFSGPGLCFTLYALLLSFTAVCGVLNMHILYYRMILIKYAKKSEITLRLSIFSFFYFIPTIVMVLHFISPTDFEFVYAETRLTHSQYDFEPFLKFGGVSNQYHISVQLINLFLVTLAAIIPFGWVFRREAMKDLEKNKLFSSNTINQLKSLLNGLAVQIIVPVLCYAPSGIALVFNKFSESKSILSEYIILVFITFPAAVDPIFFIYFIAPYRRAIAHFLQIIRFTEMTADEASRRDYNSLVFPAKNINNINVQKKF